MASACADVIRAAEEQQRKRAELFLGCAESLDCKSWCNEGNCGQVSTHARSNVLLSPSPHAALSLSCCA